MFGESVSDMTLKIGIDYSAAVHQSAGIGRYTQELIKALAAVAADDFKVHYQLFVAQAGANFALPLPGDNFSWSSSRLSERWLKRLWYRLRLPLPIQSWTGPLDLFHATDFVLPPVKQGTTTMVTIHDLSFVRQPESVMPGMSNYLNTWVPRSVAQADHVIAVSEATRQDLISLYDTPPQKVSVLYHGVTPEFQPIQTETALKAVRQKYNLGEAPFILSLGTIQPRKNYQRLIQALAQIKAPLALVIGGGRGWHYDAIFGEVERQGLQERVHFPGFVADEDLPALYSAATLFVYPSLYEGFGLPLLEAMACGTPVVSSNQSSLPEVVEQAGVLVNPYEVDDITQAMSNLLDDETRRQKLSVAGLEQAAKFSWDEMAQKLVKLYQTVLSV